MPELKRMGVVTETDFDAIVIYCDTWSRWKQAVLFLRKNGNTYEALAADGTTRRLVAYPEVAIAKGLLPILNRYQQESGMTPAARSRIEVPEQAPGGGVLEFLGIAKP